MRRRKILSLMFLSAFSGCLEGHRRPDARLDWIRVSNGHGVEDSHEITVSIIEDEAVLFEKTHTVDDEPTYDTKHEQSPGEGPGKYVVQATTDSGMEAEIDTAEQVTEENECIGVHFVVVSDELHAYTRSKCFEENG